VVASGGGFSLILLDALWDPRYPRFDAEVEQLIGNSLGEFARSMAKSSAFEFHVARQGSVGRATQAFESFRSRVNDPGLPLNWEVSSYPGSWKAAESFCKRIRVLIDKNQTVAPL
jgi:hypothetical protein